MGVIIRVEKIVKVLACFFFALFAIFMVNISMVGKKTAKTNSIVKTTPGITRAYTHCSGHEKILNVF